MSWSGLSAALGVSKQAAHKRFTGLTPTFQRFTDKARSTVQGATDQARAFGHTDIGAEHLLLSLFEPADGLAALTLSRLGLQRGADYASAEMLEALGAQKDAVRRETLDGLRRSMEERNKQSPKTG
jgi:ATP-dependent Clp protease ATP-binding subunit ClpA